MTFSVRWNIQHPDLYDLYKHYVFSLRLLLHY